MARNLHTYLRSLKNRLLWKIKHRLVLTNVFIGVIPILLMLAISWYAGLLFYYQFSYYLITNQISIHSAQIGAFSVSMKDRLQETAYGSESPALSMREALDSGARFLISSYPSAIIILHFRDPNTGKMITYINHGMNTGTIETYTIPAWVQEHDFRGLVVEDLQQDIHGGQLFIRSFVGPDFMSDLEFSLEVSVPFDQYFLSRLKAALGQDVLLADRVTIPKLNVMFQNIDVRNENIVDSTFDREKDSDASWSGWLFSLFPVSWEDGEERSAFDLGVLLVEPSAAKLLANIHESDNPIGKRILVVLLAVVSVFLLAEVASILIGIKLTKSITGAVRNLDTGTEFIKRGDFSHRINVRSKDQLGALATSFNQMTEYVQQWIRERVLKERMERELEIAKEVQIQLFPSHPPVLDHLDVSGVCLPARVVSGDFFDYLPLDGAGLGIAVGDICGKGISAALLMANLQATLRSNVLNLQQQDIEQHESSVADIVQRMNYQMFGYTADNRFATLFYAVYNDTDRTLTYCNAGHNPPLYFEGDTVRPLPVGGTVIGIFSDSTYDQDHMQLNPGGVLVAYTDGIIESVNQHGEEFGGARLVELVQHHIDLDAETIKDRVLESVLAWVSADERDDDMTLIVAKVRPAGP